MAKELGEPIGGEIDPRRVREVGFEADIREDGDDP
jgi:hypothetical protein